MNLRSHLAHSFLPADLNYDLYKRQFEDALTKIEKGQWEHARRLLEWCEERWPDDEPRKYATLTVAVATSTALAPAGGSACVALGTPYTSTNAVTPTSAPSEGISTALCSCTR